jgi:hypothetical protein
MNTLQEIFNKHKCDKASRHRYDLIYEKELEQYRDDSDFVLLEIGIFKGESISAWLDYFPNIKQIIGIDLFDRINPEDIPILKHPKVKYFRSDSMSPTLPTLLQHHDISVDVIIDDGLHSPEANRKTFENLFQFLNPNGKYFIEDVWPLDILTKAEKQHQWLKRHPKRYTMSEYNKFLNTVNQYDVTRFDNRKITKNPDSYIFKIIK